MKKYLLFIALALSTYTLYAQKTKPEKEEAPSAEEMQKLMKEAQMELENLSDEDKKAMEEMGIKVPSFNNVPNVNDAQLKEAYENEMRLVPLMDNERIASISKTPLTDAQIPAYLAKVHKQLSDKLGAGLSAPGEKLYQWLKNKYKTPPAIANAGVGFWMMGKPQLALYLVSKACQDDPGDGNNLNNLAALLTMSGAEQYAIPLLDHLNKRFPQNSTILNNLGQAWFGLGDVTKAQSNLDNSIRLCAFHPQANVTKSRIEESKGEKANAVESMKRSVKQAYSNEKVDRLRSLGYELQGDDISWNFKPNPNPLGLGSFKHPAFPTSVVSSVALEVEWNEFRERCSQEIQKLDGQMKIAEEYATEAYEKRIKENSDMVRNAVSTANPNGQLTLMPFFAPKALLKKQEMYKDGGFVYRGEKALKDKVQYIEDKIPLEDAYEKQITKLKKEDNEQTGEGLPNKDFCPKYKSAADNFLLSYNPEWQSLTDEQIHQTRLLTDEMLYWDQYILWPEQFEVAQLNAKIEWLRMLMKLTYKSITVYDCEPKEVPQKMTKLGKFNEMHCMYHSKLDLYVGTITTDCDKTVGTLDLAILKDVLGIEIGKIEVTTLQGDRDDETFMDQFQCATVEIGLHKSVGIGKGPIKAEAKFGGSGFVEFDKYGFADAGAKVSVDFEVGTNVIENGIGPVQDQSITIAGAEAQLTIGSGFTTDSKFLGSK